MEADAELDAENADHDVEDFFDVELFIDKR